MENRIKEILSEEFSDIEFAMETDEDNIATYDSLTLAGIIAILSGEFDISIPGDEISEENFASITAMADMVRRLQGKGE